MGFDKAKVMRAAEKYLAQGKIAAAINEYRSIVTQDGQDFSALNTLGDLHVRTGQKAEAVGCFRLVAEHYRQQGFTTKAIALYKKIDRLEPGDPEVAANLAALYETQGLMVEARAQYMIVAEAYSRGGQQHRALEVLRRIADLDPQNTEIRIQLAQSFMRENLQTEAAATFAEAGQQFLARGVYDRALSAFALALDINPRDAAALSGMLQAHIALGTADEAAEMISRAVSAEPDNVSLLSMLVTAYVESEDAPAAERATALLVKQDASAYDRFVDVARLYINQTDLNAAVRVLGSIAEQMLARREEARLLEILNEVLARDPEQIPALHLLIRIHTWQRDDDKLRAALERLAEAAEAAGLVDEERRALVQLVHLTSEQHHLDRLQALGGAATETTEPEADAPPVEVEVPGFESFALVDEDFTTAAAMGLPVDEETTEFEWNAVVPPSASELQGEAPADSYQSDPSSSFADLNDQTDWAMSDSFMVVSSEQPPEPSFSGFQEIDFSSETLTAPPPPVQSGNNNGTGPKTTALDAQRENFLRQELESVDFYIAQGYTDIALDTLEMLEREFGSHEGIVARRARLTEQQPAPSASTEAEPEVVVEFKGFESYDVAEESAAPVTATKQNERLAQPSPAPAERVEEGRAQNAQPAASEGIDPGLAAIFDEFRTAVEDESPTSDAGDYETHYNLGIAYKEMDLLDQAIEEFQTAAALAAPGDKTARYLQCCNMLGHCFMQKGMGRLAVMWFKKGLESPGHSEDEYQALRYDLGLAYEQMGDIERAIEIFTEVYGVNVSYRGVGEKLRELQLQKTSR